MITTRRFLQACAITIIAASPLIAHGQATTSDPYLSQTIRAEITQDPRASGMTDAEINAMVQALSEQAQAQGMTAHDISWRPAPDSPAGNLPPRDACGRISSLLCHMNEAFGFSGSDITIPLSLLISSLLAMFVIGLMLERHYAHVHAMKIAAALESSPQKVS